MDVQVVQLDDNDDAPTVVYVPGTAASGVTEPELAQTLEGYATKLYVDSAVTGGTPGAIQDLIDTSIATHRDSSTPHPAYDAMRSLTLLFENRLV